MTRTGLAATLILAFALTSLGPAASAQIVPDDAPWAVPEVVVRTPTPRLWKVTRGDSIVYVIGTIEPLPTGLSWNMRQIDRILSGANRLILRNADRDLASFDYAKAVLPTGHTLDEMLTEAQQGRLRGLLARLGRAPDSVNAYKPAWAALELTRALNDLGVLSSLEPSRGLRQLARRKGVSVVIAGSVETLAMLDDLTEVPDDQGLTLLMQTIDAVERQLDHADEIGRAWASGDLRVLRETQGVSVTPLRLLQVATPAGRAASARMITDERAAIEDALSQQGVSVTTFNLNALARKGGLIDALRAEGLAVVEPAD